MSTSTSSRPVAAHAPAGAFRGQAAVTTASAGPAGTFASGTKIQVGSHKVVIDRYLSEGGFAHVYLVKLAKAVDGAAVAVLKRVAVPDKEALANMRTEVETMKKLKGHRAVVTYIDSHASQLKGGGYEVFLLMEYCAGGGLIDFMNTRLQNRLSEAEVLKIFADVAEGVACMHYLQPPLLHRDLKVENVLIASAGPSRRYKLCDFGSTAPPRAAASDAAECRRIEEDVQKHTTLQYRSPEMIDVYRKQAIDEKSDIWALGVLLYKLCYYTTPFEQQGQLAILNASFKFPAYPAFSDRLKKLIASMLREAPALRPNIYQVLREACAMQGVAVPIKDIYAGRAPSQRASALPDASAAAAAAAAAAAPVGAVRAAPEIHRPAIPDIVPMRRGRPGAPAPSSTAAAAPAKTKPSPSPLRGAVPDPFKALDRKTAVASAEPALDELSARFPTLDQFSLLHETGAKFDFDHGSPASPPPATKDISQRVTERLADDAFARPAAATRAEPSPPRLAVSRDAATSAAVPLPAPVMQKPSMVSQGTMTSPPPSPPEAAGRARPSASQTDAAGHRSSSQSGSSEARPRRVSPSPSDLRIHMPTSSRPFLPSFHRSRSSVTAQPPSPSSLPSHPAIDEPRPSSADRSSWLGRSRSIHVRPRPTSAYMGSEAEQAAGREPMAGLVAQASGKRRSAYDLDGRGLTAAVTGGSGEEAEAEAGKIADNVDFLRAMEEQDGSRRREKRSSSGSKSSKRSSLPSISLASTKTLLAGRFGEAFRRFEGNAGAAAAPQRSGSPPLDDGRRGLSPIAGSEATGDLSDVEHGEDPESLTGEMKRELERLRLAQEERRVEAAAADYRQRLAQRDRAGARAAGPGPAARAASIQNKVKTLLTENERPSSRVADVRQTLQPAVAPDAAAAAAAAAATARSPPDPYPARKPVGREPDGSARAEPSSLSLQPTRYPPRVSSVKPSLSGAPTSRPSAPPKPTALRRAGPAEAVAGSSTTPATASTSSSRDTDLPAEEWEESFSRRYPSLGRLEMVETAIEKNQPVAVRSKEV